MMFKVYAQNCVCAPGNRITEVNNIEPYIREVFDYASNMGIVDLCDNNNPDEISDEKYDAALCKIEEYWNRTKVLNCGDYYIVQVDSRDDVVIPSMCGNDATIIFG